MKTFGSIYLNYILSYKMFNYFLLINKNFVNISIFSNFNINLNENINKIQILNRNNEF